MPNFPRTKGLDPLVWTDTKAGFIDAAASAIKAKTDPLPADPASESGAIKGDTAAIKTTTDANLDAKVSERATPAQILVDPVTDKIDGSQIDASVASRSSHAPADILVDPVTDKIDGSMIDASIVSRATPGDILKTVGEKVDGARIDSILAGAAPLEGTCSPSVLGTAEVVVQQELGVLFYLEGHIDLSAMLAGDTITLDESISVVTPVDYKKYADAEYSGVQDLPLLYVETKPGRYGIKLELTQTLGTLRTFPYQFFVRRVV